MARRKRNSNKNKSKNKNKHAKTKKSAKAKLSAEKTVNKPNKKNKSNKRSSNKTKKQSLNNNVDKNKDAVQTITEKETEIPVLTNLTTDDKKPSSSVSISETSHSKEQLNELLKQQKSLALELRTSTVADRSEKLEKLRDSLLEHKIQIQEALQKDLNKAPADTDMSEIMPVLLDIQYALKHIHQWMRIDKRKTPLMFLGSKADIQYEPKGVCLILAPWNYPLALCLSPLVSALAAGNTAVIKPSEFTPATAAVLEKIIKQAFNPAEVAVVHGDHNIAAQLCKLAFDHCFFTGSPAVGKKVMTACAQNLTSVTLELGGKSPALVELSAHLKSTANKIAIGKFLNCGQTCIAPDYVLVPEFMQAHLIDALKKAVIDLYGHMETLDTISADYPRCIHHKHTARLLEMLESDVANGAIIEHGGQYDLNQRFFAPTIVSNLPINSRLMQEEIFGPILPIVTYSDIDEAIDSIKQGAKPLALYLFGKDRYVRERVMNECSAGSILVNDTLLQYLHPELPFGGVNGSGIGKTRGEFGFREFSNAKARMRQFMRTPLLKLLLPPYTKRSNKIRDFVLKYLQR